MYMCDHAHVGVRTVLVPGNVRGYRAIQNEQMAPKPMKIFKIFSIMNPKTDHDDNEQTTQNIDQSITPS